MARIIKKILISLIAILFFVIGFVCFSLGYWATTLNWGITAVLVPLSALFWTITVWLIHKLQ